MKKIILVILEVILTLQIVTALSMYSGETKVIEFEDIVKDCYIYNNQSDLIGLTLVENGRSVIISTVPNYKPDNWTLSCMVEGVLVEKDADSKDWTIIQNITNTQFVNFFIRNYIIINIIFVFSIGLNIYFIAKLIIRKKGEIKLRRK